MLGQPLTDRAAQRAGAGTVDDDRTSSSPGQQHLVEVASRAARAPPRRAPRAGRAAVTTRAAARRRISSASTSRGAGPLIGSSTTSTSSAGTTTRMPSVSRVTRPVRPLTSAIRPCVPSVRLRPHRPTRGCGAAGSLRLRRPRRPASLVSWRGRLGAPRELVEGGGRRRARRVRAAGEVPLAGHLAAHLGDLALGAGQHVVGGSVARRRASRPPRAARATTPLRARSRSSAALASAARARSRPRCAAPPPPRCGRGWPPCSPPRPRSGSARRRGSAPAGPSRLAMANAWLLPGRPIVEPVRRSQRAHVELDRRVGDAGMRLGEGLELRVVGRGHHPRARARAGARPRPSPAPSPRRDPCRLRPRRAGPGCPHPASPTKRTMLRRWLENVESDWAMLCSSPMSAITRRYTGSRAPAAAGTRRPDWCMRASRPSVLRLTVLPPVFGPVTTMARCPKRSPRRRSMGTAAVPEQRVTGGEQLRRVGRDLGPHRVQLP